jgi:hypothetical protein
MVGILSQEVQVAKGAQSRLLVQSGNLQALQQNKPAFARGAYALEDEGRSEGEHRARMLFDLQLRRDRPLQTAKTLRRDGVHALGT